MDDDEALARPKIVAKSLNAVDDRIAALERELAALSESESDDDAHSHDRTTSSPSIKGTTKPGTGTGHRTRIRMMYRMSCRTHTAVWTLL